MTNLLGVVRVSAVLLVGDLLGELGEGLAAVSDGGADVVTADREHGLVVPALLLGDVVEVGCGGDLFGQGRSFVGGDGDVVSGSRRDRRRRGRRERRAPS